MACCLKAISTSDANQMIETCRFACGGHGYMTSSNFPTIYSSLTAAVTYEGENTVLLLQTARFVFEKKKYIYNITNFLEEFSGLVFKKQNLEKKSFVSKELLLN